MNIRADEQQYSIVSHYRNAAPAARTISFDEFAEFENDQLNLAQYVASNT
jgi:hypothetical protein